MVSFHDFIAFLIIFNHGKIRFSPLSKNVDMSPDSGQGYEAEGVRVDVAVVQPGSMSCSSILTLIFRYPNLTTKPNLVLLLDVQ